jgi:ribA/ribD-fused uncharacterized protein
MTSGILPDISSFDGQYRFLSNFWICSINYDGHTWRSVEHAYQAMKTSDPEERRRIRELATPGQAKRAGPRRCGPDWHEAKVEIMRQLVRAKFQQNTELAAKLIATGDAYLEEGNHWSDRFWGSCDNTGLNWLGRILMEVREELRGRRSDKAGQ